jgi:dienelactone hydrolase
MLSTASTGTTRSRSLRAKSRVAKLRRKPKPASNHGIIQLNCRQFLSKRAHSGAADSRGKAGVLWRAASTFHVHHAKPKFSDCEGHVRAWAERSFDAYGALRYLQAQRYVIGDHIGLMGWSHGGGTTMFVVAPRNVARPTDLPEGDFRAAVAFYPAWCGLPGNDWTPKIPLLLEIGLQDDSISPKPCIDKVSSAIEHGSP